MALIPGLIANFSDANQTGAEIKTAYEAESDTNAYTDAEKAKLSGIEAEANNYEHPPTHAPSIITQDADNRFVTDAEKTVWNAKQDAEAGKGLSTNDYTDTEKTKLADLDTDQEAKDEDKLLRDWTNKLMSGTAPGSEREWEIFEVISITLGDTVYESKTLGETTRIRISNITDFTTSMGYSWTQISQNHKIFVFSDSGNIYDCIEAEIYANSESLGLHPKHGDVRSDFTAGNTYTVIVCREQTTGTLQTTSLPVTEHFLGTDIDTVAEITAVVGATPVSGEIITLGVWQGKDFADMRPDGSQTEFQLSRKALATPTSVLVDGVATTAFTFSAITNSLTMTSPVASTSYLTAVYTTPPRRLRQSIFPRDVKADTKQVTFHNRSNSGGEVTLCDLLSSVFIGGSQLIAGSSNTYASIPITLSDMSILYTVLFGINFGAIPDSAVSKLSGISPAIAFTVILNVVGTTYKISFLFKELIYDTDWGDDGIIPVVDNVVTTTDDNGNVVLCGCMSYDTGIEV